MKVPVRLIRTDEGFDIVHRTERIHVRGMPEALSLSRRDVTAYLALLQDEAQAAPGSEKDESPSDIEEVLRKCHALQ